ncbi:MAG: hypothetical protein ACFFCR_11835 [Promethearchaeota archaeon]
MTAKSGMKSMSDSLKEITVTGLMSKIFDSYTVTMDDGTEYKLSAIMPWEAVSAGFDSGKFAVVLGKRVSVSGMTDGDTIWGAEIAEGT